LEKKGALAPSKKKREEKTRDKRKRYNKARRETRISKTTTEGKKKSKIWFRKDEGRGGCKYGREKRGGVQIVWARCNAGRKQKECGGKKGKMRTPREKAVWGG